MVAVAPLLLETSVLDEPQLTVVEPELVDPESVHQEIAAYNLLLARSREIPASVRLFVEEMADDLANLPVEATLRTDPYLLVALQKSLLAALRALENPEPSVARRDLRVRLEQLRQVYRDLADARPIYEDRPAKDLVLWLADATGVPQVRLADLLGVSARTLQRWLSQTDASQPMGDEARRVRLVSTVAGHLRHALTGHGVVEWFARAHPMLGGRRPADLLDEPDALPRLSRLAASTRSALTA